MATHANTTYYDFSAILSDAWRRYRLVRPTVYAAGDVGEKRVFLRSFFAKMLRMAWADAFAVVRSILARDAERVAAELRAKLREGQIHLTRRMSPEERSARITAVRDQIAVLDYAPFGVHIRMKRAALNDELTILATA